MSGFSKNDLGMHTHTRTTTTKVKVKSVPTPLFFARIYQGTYNHSLSSHDLRTLCMCRQMLMWIFGFVVIVFCSDARQVEEEEAEASEA